jgi:EF hand
MSFHSILHIDQHPTLRQMKRWFVFYAVILAVAALLSGCGGSGIDRLTRNDPALAADKVMQLYDRNSDGEITADELQNAPSLAAGRPRIDSDQDGTMTKEEIQRRMETILSGADYFPVNVHVKAKGKPLVGATVTLTPESFIGDGYQTFTGTTVDGGVGSLQGDGKQLPGIPAGFYQAKIVHTSQGIDAVRGVEISDETASRDIQIAL